MLERELNAFWRAPRIPGRTERPLKLAPVRGVLTNIRRRLASGRLRKHTVRRHPLDERLEVPGKHLDLDMK